MNWHKRSGETFHTSANSSFFVKTASKKPTMDSERQILHTRKNLSCCPRTDIWSCIQVLSSVCFAVEPAARRSLHLFWTCFIKVWVWKKPQKYSRRQCCAVQFGNSVWKAHLPKGSFNQRSSTPIVVSPELSGVASRTVSHPRPHKVRQSLGIWGQQNESLRSLMIRVFCAECCGICRPNQTKQLATCTKITGWETAWSSQSASAKELIPTFSAQIFFCDSLPCRRLLFLFCCWFQDAEASHTKQSDQTIWRRPEEVQKNFKSTWDDLLLKDSGLKNRHHRDDGDRI